MSAQSACGITHVYLLSGPCPWCGRPVINGKVVSVPPTTPFFDRKWNIPALSDALDNEGGGGIQTIAISNLMHHGTRVLDVLPVLRRALHHASPDLHKHASYALVSLGARLTSEESQHFEDMVKANPTDHSIRILLIGYYFERTSLFESARIAIEGHVLWIISNAPESEIAGTPYAYLDPRHGCESVQKAKQMWLEKIQTHGKNVTVLGNAANFFMHSDRQLSESLFTRAQLLDPTNPKWPERRAYLLSLGIERRNDEMRRELASQSFVQLEAALSLMADDQQRFGLLDRICKAALDAGNVEIAQLYASELLTKAALPAFKWDAAYSIHHGNLILGRIALRKGDIERAKLHLIEAGKIPGSPELNSFGPNMMLAKELLEKGERNVVIQYLTLSASFWQTNDHLSDKWIYAITQGLIPDFGPNLSY